jgi:HSP20 family molecular chaperone IbpA
MSELTQKERAEATAVERTRGEPSYTPRFDIYEGDDELLLVGDLPGVTAENLDIRYENRELSIYGKVAPREPQARSLHREYGVGDFYRAFTIAENLEADKFRAELRHGVLTLHLPKSEAVKPRRIEVRGE